MSYGRTSCDPSIILCGIMTGLCCVFLLASFLAQVQCQYQPNWNSLDSRTLPAWYDQAKFGIFVVWGAYSVPSYGGGAAHRAGEWFWWYWQGANDSWAVDFIEENYPPGFTYPDFASMFKAELFDPDEWAELFQASGANYIVLTSKHHEGWTNWKSQTAWNWNAVDNGPHMDLVGALANSIRKKTSIHFGLYFSQFEWFNPIYLQDKSGGFKTQAYVEEVSYPQMYEIVNSYHPDVIWSDGDWEASDTYWNSTEFLAWLYNESPVKDSVVVNDRWGSGCSCKHGGFYTCADRYNPHVLQQHKWENAMTIDRYSWGFRRDATFQDYLSIEELLQELVTTVSCGGNVLLNVGPTHDGRIAPIFEERLKQIGQWLSVNGEAIYNTVPWTHQNDTINPNVWYTYNAASKAVYGILLEAPSNYSVAIGAVKTSPSSTISMLGYSGKVEWKTEGAMVTVTLPFLPPDTNLKWAWALKLENVAPNL